MTDPKTSAMSTSQRIARSKACAQVIPSACVTLPSEPSSESVWLDAPAKVRSKEFAESTMGETTTDSAYLTMVFNRVHFFTPLVKRV